MDDARTVRDEATDLRSPDVSAVKPSDEYAARAADLSAELYAREERTRRRESLEELLSRDRHA